MQLYKNKIKNLLGNWRLLQLMGKIHDAGTAP